MNKAKQIDVEALPNSNPLIDDPVNKAYGILRFMQHAFFEEKNDSNRINYVNDDTLTGLFWVHECVLHALDYEINRERYEREIAEKLKV